MLRACFAVRPDLAGKFYRFFAAVCLRRVERNSVLPYRDRQKRTAVFATTKQERHRGPGRSMVPALV